MSNKHRTLEELEMRSKKREEKSKKPDNVGMKLRKRRHGIGRHRSPSKPHIQEVSQ